MTGQIPPYGEHFRRESTRYDETRTWASRRYALKADTRWDVTSDPTSELWQVRLDGAAVSGIRTTMAQAMDLLLDGIEDGYYRVRGDVHATCKCVRPGARAGTEKKAARDVYKSYPRPQSRGLSGIGSTQRKREVMDRGL